MDYVQDFYSELKNIATTMYYADSRYGKNSFYEKMYGEDVRTYKIPMNMFIGKEGIFVAETGQAEFDYDVGNRLGQLAEADGWHVGSTYHGEADGPTVYMVELTASVEKLKEFKQDLMQQQKQM